MSVEENKAVARRWYEEVVAQGNLALIDELFAPDFMSHNPPLPSSLDRPLAARRGCFHVSTGPLHPSRRGDVAPVFSHIITRRFARREAMKQSAALSA